MDNKIETILVLLGKVHLIWQGGGDEDIEGGSENF